jgi:hypothetical protein
MDRRSDCSAACAINVWPTSVEPVNVSRRSRRSSIMGVVTEAEEDAVMTLTTPAGTPARWRMSASARVENGVCFAGLRTMVQPAASAGATSLAAITSGQFQGRIASVVPTGWRMMSIRRLPSGATWNPPSIRTASSENQRRYPAAYAASSRDWASGLPISRVMTSASSSVRATTSS